MKLKMFITKIAKSTVKAMIRTVGFGILQFFCKEKTDMDLDTARQLLEQVSPCPEGNTQAKNQMLPCEYDLQIVIPAYNAERYLKECVDSILSQETSYTYKIVLINDGSADSTGAIADSYSFYPNVEVIHQENRGFSGARNRGLERICAKYIAFVDSDDQLAPGAIEALMSAAIKEQAEIVEGGFYRLIGDQLSVSHTYKEKKTVKPLNTLTGFPWGKVWKSDIFLTLKYPEGFWFEDSIFSFLVYPKNYRSVLIPEVVYIYRDNPNGITNTSANFSKSVDTYWITEMLIKECRQQNISFDEAFHEKLMRQVILNAKRTSKLPIDAQKAIFVLTGSLVTESFEKEAISPKYKKLDRALRNGNWGLYRLYCKTH